MGRRRDRSFGPHQYGGTSPAKRATKTKQQETETKRDNTMSAAKPKKDEKNPPGGVGAAGNPDQHSINETLIAGWTRRLGIYTGVLAVATVLLVVATGISTYFLWRSDVGVEGQLGEMQQQRLLTITQIRANLRREQPTYFQIREDGELRGPGDKLGGFAISPNWKNIGSTNAVEYRGWFNLRTFSHGGQHTVTVKDCPELPAPIPLPEGLVVLPGGPISQLARTFSLADAVEAKSQTKYILLWGHIEYRDIYPDTPTYHDDWCEIVLRNDIEKAIFSFPTLQEKVD